MEYSALRNLVDSWGMLAMVVFFIAASAWALRPSQRRAQEEAANIPFKED
ncbi:MAG: cbb3-type cytochrome c oxidase subunit 3 [Alphaproteobacteria bacterium]|nr:cbb3-type cytochrome c oxidase subunit 3 [Alphaproteobacteria bacterium]